MVNIECQSNSLVLDNHLHLLPRIGSSTNLYHYLIKNKSSPPTVVDCDTDRPMGTSMTSSLSSDSAIVLDDIVTSDHSDFLQQSNTCRNSWPSSMDTNVPSIISLAKYKRPLPWTNSPSPYASPKQVQLVIPSSLSHTRLLLGLHHSRTRLGSTTRAAHRERR